MKCPYCGDETQRVRGSDLYPHRPDLRHRRFVACLPCKAWVGVHGGTGRPLGTIADATLRRARQRAHGAFDPIWKSGGMKRTKAYVWLASQLGIEVERCHIAMFSEATCDRVVEICMARELKGVA